MDAGVSAYEGLTAMGVDPNDVEPVHPPRNQKKLRIIARQMRENGWQGRSILVVQTESGFRAITGSHRIVAARLAKLPAIPCASIRVEDLQQSSVMSGNSVEAIIDAIIAGRLAGERASPFRRFFDPERLGVLLHYKLRHAALLLIEEIQVNTVEGILMEI